MHLPSFRKTKPKPLVTLNYKFTFFCSMLMFVILKLPFGFTALLAILLVWYVSGFRYFLKYFLFYAIYNFNDYLQIASGAVSLVTSLPQVTFPITPFIYYTLLILTLIMAYGSIFETLVVTYFIGFRLIPSKRNKAIKQILNKKR